MFEKVPTSLKLAAVIGILFAGPLVLFGFYFGGAIGGTIAVVALFFYFIIVYMISFRKSM